jgi:hypothetical protein
LYQLLLFEVSGIYRINKDACPPVILYRSVQLGLSPDRAVSVISAQYSHMIHCNIFLYWSIHSDVSERWFQWILLIVRYSAYIDLRIVWVLTVSVSELTWYDFWFKKYPNWYEGKKIITFSTARPLITFCVTYPVTYVYIDYKVYNVRLL